MNCALPVRPISRAVAGMDFQPKSVRAQLVSDMLAVGWNTSLRFGGDGYNWKTCTAQWNSSTKTTLQALREARDRNSTLQMCTNTRGIGPGNGSTWAYTDTTPEAVATLVADWVRYGNVILQTYRAGDVLPPADQALLDALAWSGDKLLAPGEPATPRVTDWEIGNEPEGPYPPPALTPADYAARYKAMTAAMLAVDPTIRVGPCVMSADNGNAWLDAVFADPANRVDFVAYHPYGPLYWITKNNAGGTLSGPDLQRGLLQMRQQQSDRRQKVVDRLVAAGRPADTPLIASEWNPSSWEGTYYYSLNRTAAQGLGTAETVFAFADFGFRAAQYWDFPNYPSTTAIETPCSKVFKALQQYMGDRLLDRVVDGTLRVYTTADTSAGRIAVWAINFSDSEPHDVRIQLSGLGPVRAVTQQTLAAVSGDTGLAMLNATGDAYDKVNWTVTDRTGHFDPADMTLTVDDATLTLLLIDADLPPLPDAPIKLSTDAISRTVGASVPLADDVVTLASGGADSLSFTVAADADWLSVTPADGAAGPAGTPLHIRYDARRLPIGETPP